ncbi:MAG: hypothetical protein J6X34_09590 [Clostridia bacterium]|nr:hypothetical protein [Clostridia bacterium]MBP5781469.1 hypothetical protein [Clostridia bacterium]
MKKTVVFMIICLISAVFLLTSCGIAIPGFFVDDDPPLTREENTGEAIPDFSSIMVGNGKTDTVWGLQDPSARQQIIDSAKADGYDVSFGNDGSMTVKDKDGTVFVQGPDGTWTMQGEEGQSTQLGGNWPDNEFTKLVPKPDFKLAGASTSDDGFSAAFQSVSVAEIKAYAEKVKAKGFTVDAAEEDQNVYGVVVYTYAAYNASGYRVQISFASGTGGITISK